MGHDVMMLWQKVLTCNWKVQSCGDKGRGHVPARWEGKCQRGWIEEEDDGASHQKTLSLPGL